MDNKIALIAGAIIIAGLFVAVGIYARPSEFDRCVDNMMSTLPQESYKDRREGAVAWCLPR